MSSTDPILEAVREIVADVSALDVDEVKPSDGYFTDLDGESIGLLEISFQSEKRFGVKLALQKAFPEEQLVTDEKGVLTPESMSLLKRELPFLDYSRIEANPLKNRLSDLLTVEAIAHFVKRAIAEKGAAAAPAGGFAQPV